uniref:Uncharacterized protein n=1 Tax=Chrysotila carterae TaxID=13221 RepID=A0A7S4ESU5_CHRCT
MLQLRLPPRGGDCTSANLSSRSHRPTERHVKNTAPTARIADGDEDTGFIPSARRAETSSDHSFDCDHVLGEPLETSLRTESQSESPVFQQLDIDASPRASYPRAALRRAECKAEAFHIPGWCEPSTKGAAAPSPMTLRQMTADSEEALATARERGEVDGGGVLASPPPTSRNEVSVATLKLSLKGAYQIESETRANGGTMPDLKTSLQALDLQSLLALTQALVDLAGKMANTEPRHQGSAIR